jgi:hypothetical protein
VFEHVERLAAVALRLNGCFAHCAGVKSGGVHSRKPAERLNYPVSAFLGSTTAGIFSVSEVGVNRTAVRQLVEEHFRASILQGRYNGEHNVDRETALTMALDLNRPPSRTSRRDRRIDATIAG